MEIRAVDPSQYEAAGRVTAGAYAEFAPPGDAEWAEYLQTIADVGARAERMLVIAAVEEGRILGTATLEMEQTLGDDDAELPPDTASLRMLGVAPAARGRGVGRALLEVCLERARAAGKRVMVLRTTERMEVAAALYRSLGFERDPARDLDGDLRLVAYRLAL